MIGIRSLSRPIFFFTFEMSQAQAGVIIFRFPSDDSRPDLHQLFIAARLSGTWLLMSVCCNSVNKSEQFTIFRAHVYLQTERWRFLKHVIIPQKRQVFHYKYAKTPHWRFQKKKSEIVATQAPELDQSVW